MDRLPLALAATMVRVDRVQVRRVVDASKRRGPLQTKVGNGITPEEFHANVKAGKMGHVGLPESVALIAPGLGWRVDEIRQNDDCGVSDPAQPRARGRHG